MGCDSRSDVTVALSHNHCLLKCDGQPSREERGKSIPSPTGPQAKAAGLQSDLLISGRAPSSAA